MDIDNFPKQSNFSKFVVSAQYAAKAIFYSKKWFIYILMVFIPLFYGLFLTDPLGGQNANQAFIVNVVLGIQLLFFSFGCLFVALPISSDDITDNVIDLFLTRPIGRPLLYFARWCVLIVGLVIINLVIGLVYFSYYQLADPNTSGLQGFADSIELFFKVIIFYIVASFVYGSLFLLIGFIGKRGFTIGILLAVFELFFLRFFFLEDNALMPVTNLQVIADGLFGDLYNYIVPPTVILPDITASVLYIIVSTILLVSVGILYFRKKQIN